MPADQWCWGIHCQPHWQCEGRPSRPCPAGLTEGHPSRLHPAWLTECSCSCCKSGGTPSCSQQHCSFGTEAIEAWCQELQAEGTCHQKPGCCGSSSKALAAEALLSKPGSTFPHKSETSAKARFHAHVPIYKQQPANANRSSAPAVQAGANVSTQQQRSATGKRGRVAAPGSTHRQQPGGGNKVRAPAAKRGAPLPSPSQQQTSNRSSAFGVSKAGVQSSHAHTRSKAHSVARPAAQKQPPAAAWKTQSQTAAQHSASRTALLSSGATALSAQPPQPAQGPSGPMSYAKAAGKGVPKEQDRLLVMDRVPMDNLVFPYLPRQSDSVEEKQAKKLVFDNLTELATGQHQTRSCRHIAGSLH